MTCGDNEDRAADAGHSVAAEEWLAKFDTRFAAGGLNLVENSVGGST
jgi:hypothetical protein